MPSDAESFLGIGGERNQDTGRPPILFVRRVSVWILLIVIGYLSSFFWLGAFVVMVPVLMMEAPAGLLSLFIHPFDPHTQQGEQYIGIVHAIFWPIYLLGLLGSQWLNVHILRILFIVVAAVVVLTMYGCAANFHISPGDLH
jgi:uncharacterized membrane protein YfcA